MSRGPVSEAEFASMRARGHLLGAAAWAIATGLLPGGLREIRNAQASGAAA